MAAATSVIYYIFHPQELRSIIQWKVWHNAVHERDLKNETETQKICFDFLDRTSRSFSAVIQELHPELLLPVCVFYLALRGLDTIEDDPSIPLEKKEPLLRGFKDILTKDGWTFDGNRPEEKDRELLVRFDNVITEYNGLKPAYQKIIFDITNEMGNGMADYCRRAHEKKNMDTVEQYDLYCHYVAGLVGEGLTRLFVEAGFGNPALLGRPALYNSMGLFLQKTNIVRDIKEDDEDQRWFWPKEIWSKHVDNWDDLFKPEHREAALNCSSEMVLNALNHADECLFYLAGLKEQSVFNFCAIPQTMAIATLELCFRNPAMFERNIKITKGEACQLMVESTQNLQLVCDVFRKYARKIHKKNNPKDPNFLKISVACGKIEKFIETVFPSQNPGVNKNSEQQAAEEKKKKEEEAEAAEARRDIMLIMACIFVILFVISGLMLGAAWMMGARFDLAYQDVKKGHLTPPNPSNEGHVEL